MSLAHLTKRDKQTYGMRDNLVSGIPRAYGLGEHRVELAYITPEEAKLLEKLDLYDSNPPHDGPKGIPNYNDGWGGGPGQGDAEAGGNPGGTKGDRAAHGPNNQHSFGVTQVAHATPSLGVQTTPTYGNVSIATDDSTGFYGANQDQHGGYVHHGGGVLTDKYGMAVHSGLGPVSGREEHEPGYQGPQTIDYMQMSEDYADNVLATTYDLTNPIQKSLYDAMKTKLSMVNPESITQSQMQAYARSLGVSLGDLQKAFNETSLKGMMAYGLNQQSVAAQAKAVMDGFANLGQAVYGVPDDATAEDYGYAIGKTAMASLTASDIYGLTQQYGVEPVAKALGAVGTQGTIGYQLARAFMGQPAYGMDSENYSNELGMTVSEAIAEGLIDAKDVMKTDDEGTIQGSVGFGITNSGLAQALGVNQSYKGAYVDPQKAQALGFSYSGPTQGMNPDQFGQVSGMLSNPYGQYGEYGVGLMQNVANQAANQGDNTNDAETMEYLNDTQQGSSGDEGTGAGWLQGEEVPVDTSNFDAVQMQVFNQMKTYGYSDEYAYQYANMIV